VRAGHLGYALAPLVARGMMCGARTPIFLCMHDAASAAHVLAAVEMEVLDLASHLLLGARAPRSALHVCSSPSSFSWLMLVVSCGFLFVLGFLAVHACEPPWERRRCQEKRAHAPGTGTMWRVIPGRVQA
jgi:hypothetical protein